MAAAVRPRPYRRILTSALHRRFVHASALSLLVCYIVAFLIGEKSSCKLLSDSRKDSCQSAFELNRWPLGLNPLVLWSWFPIGPCGIRSILLFISCLVVFVLRVGQMHIGARTSSSPVTTIKYLFPIHVAQTFVWYIFSAWWFSEVYKWSCPVSAQLEWVKRGRYVLVVGEFLNHAETWNPDHTKGQSWMKGQFISIHITCSWLSCSPWYIFTLIMTAFLFLSLNDYLHPRIRKRIRLSQYRREYKLYCLY